MQFGEELCQFIQDCPTPFQFTQVASKLLIDAGYTELNEQDDWGDSPPQKGFVIREKRALIAFHIGGYESGIIVGTHCDSPVLRLTKTLDKIKLKYRVADSLKYGGANLARWVDRPLRLAGCVVLKNNEIIPFDSKEPIATAASLPLHLQPKKITSADKSNICQPIYGL